MPLTPPRNTDGGVVPHDDPSIAAHTLLVRHINPSEHVVFDENLMRNRIGSSAFSATSRDPDNGMSVDLGQLLVEVGESLASMVPHGFGAVSLSVGEVRGLALNVGSDPVPENAFHGQVWGVKKSARRKLHAIALDWVVPLSGVSIR